MRALPVALTVFVTALAGPVGAARAQSAAPAGPSCAVVTSAVVAAPGANYELGETQIAARGAVAVVTSVNGYTGTLDGIDEWTTAWLGEGFPRGTVTETSFNSAAGCAPRVALAATRMGNDVTRFTFAWSPEQGHRSEATFALTDRRGRQVTNTRWQTPALLVAAGRDDFSLGISVGDELRCADPCNCSATAETGFSLRTFAFTARRQTSQVLVRAGRGPNGGPMADQPAVAVGADRQAVAYRMGDGLFVQRIDEAGAAVGAAQRFAQGSVGASTIAYRGRTLVALWAQRDAPAGPYTLRHASWDPESAQPPAAQSVAAARAGDSAMAPSVAAEGDRVVVAWFEGDARARGVVRVASTSGDLGAALAHASALTPEGGNARDPEVAVTAERTWVTWQEFSRAHPRGRLFAAQVRCAP